MAKSRSGTKDQNDNAPEVIPNMQAATIAVLDDDILLISETLSPERELIFNVLFRAIADCVCQSGGRDLKHIRKDAGHWFNSDSMHPFSFLWCCEHLNLCPDTVAHIRKIARKGVQPINANRSRSLKL